MHALTSETKEQSAGEQAGERFWPIPVCASSLGTGSIRGISWKKIYLNFKKEFDILWARMTWMTVQLSRFVAGWTTLPKECHLLDEPLPTRRGVTMTDSQVLSMVYPVQNFN